MRPGRLDRILYVSPPDREARESILKSRTSKMPLHNNISLYDLSIKTEGMSGAEVVAIVQEAAIYAMKKDPENVQTIELKHFEYALENLKPRISETLIEFYKTFGKNSNSRNL